MSAGSDKSQYNGRRGHAVIINMSNWAPFILTFNPENVKSQKKINYAIVPNIGGAFKKKYFTGFDSKEINFEIVMIDMESPTGVMEEIAYFEQLREPDPGIFGIANTFFGGNEQYPPPKVLFQFGQAYIPLVWEVMEIDIEETHFMAGHVRGVIGIPKKAVVKIHLSLDEDNLLNKANQIVKKAEVYAASAKSIAREIYHKKNATRKEMPGMIPKFLQLGKKW